MVNLAINKYFGPRDYQVCLISIAAPGVITVYRHGLGWKNQVLFATTGALPTGLSADTWYYVIPVDINTFQVTATSTGSAITTTGTQSGTHSIATDGRNKLTMMPADPFF